MRKYLVTAQVTPYMCSSFLSNKIFKLSKKLSEGDIKRISKSSKWYGEDGDAKIVITFIYPLTKKEKEQNVSPNV